VYTRVFTELASAWLAVYYSGVERTRKDRDNISYLKVFPLSRSLSTQKQLNFLWRIAMREGSSPRKKIKTTHTHTHTQCNGALAPPFPARYLTSLCPAAKERREEREYIDTIHSALLPGFLFQRDSNTTHTTHTHTLAHTI
jgi:hypothetical protein